MYWVPGWWAWGVWKHGCPAQQDSSVKSIPGHRDTYHADCRKLWPFFVSIVTHAVEVIRHICIILYFQQKHLQTCRLMYVPSCGGWSGYIKILLNKTNLEAGKNLVILILESCSSLQFFFSSISKWWTHIELERWKWMRIKISQVKTSNIAKWHLESGRMEHVDCKTCEQVLCHKWLKKIRNASIRRKPNSLKPPRLFVFHSFCKVNVNGWCCKTNGAVKNTQPKSPMLSVQARNPGFWVFTHGKECSNTCL